MLGNMLSGGIRKINDYFQNNIFNTPANITPTQEQLQSDPNALGQTQFQAPSPLGWNMDTMKLGLGGLQTVGNLVGANRAYGLARDQFNMQREFADANLNNSIQSYNTALEDRARNRASFAGDSPESAQEYIDRNRLTR